MGHPPGRPDGQCIAFESYRDGNRDIYVMNADGSEVERLTDSDAWDESPAWSPDGQRIAFDSERDGRPEIYVNERRRRARRKHAFDDWGS